MAAVAASLLVVPLAAAPDMVVHLAAELLDGRSTSQTFVIPFHSLPADIKNHCIDTVLTASLHCRLAGLEGPLPPS